MPGHVLHIEIAHRVRSLLPKGEEVGQALYLGAIAPDMGLLPGADPLISDLAHYVDTGSLAKQLVRTASNEVERAYAWGWVTHLLADAGLHPAVNDSAGTSWARSPVAHMRVEFGIDFDRLARSSGLARLRLGARPDPRYVCRALADVYGVGFDEGRVERSHRGLIWTQRLLFRLGPRAPALRRLGALFPGSVLDAVTKPSLPSSDLIDQVDVFLESVEERVAELRIGGLDDLPDYNLDTGELGDETDRYPAAVAARASLSERLG